ncbi:hypothetical protein BC828DRAFT_375675 [Blastocladiella britannica]|nr:hypothetical protein BC828DRAFT_375675 [Blastocladiella britannica]
MLAAGHTAAPGLNGQEPQQRPGTAPATATAQSANANANAPAAAEKPKPPKLSDLPEPPLELRYSPISPRTPRRDPSAPPTHILYRHELIGTGGFARCYAVSDRHGARYALKVIAKVSVRSSKHLQKLRHEIKIQFKMEHPHVVELYCYFEDDDHYYMLLELCPNKSVQEMVRARKRLTDPEARFFLRQLLQAVDYMHTKSVIHRDLKLGNIFLSADMGIKVGDFGLAAEISNENERKKTICGTPNYIAPEILSSASPSGGHSFEVDIWSIGIILYSLLIGRPPFQTADVNKIYKRIQDIEYSFPDHVPLHPDARALIEQMLQKDPLHRPTVRDLLQHRYVSGTGALRNMSPMALAGIPHGVTEAAAELEAAEAAERNLAAAMDAYAERYSPRQEDDEQLQHHSDGRGHDADNDDDAMTDRGTVYTQSRRTQYALHGTSSRPTASIVAAALPPPPPPIMSTTPPLADPAAVGMDPRLSLLRRDRGSSASSPKDYGDHGLPPPPPPLSISASNPRASTSSSTSSFSSASARAVPGRPSSARAPLLRDSQRSSSVRTASLSSSSSSGSEHQQPPPPPSATLQARGLVRSASHSGMRTTPGPGTLAHSLGYTHDLAATSRPASTAAASPGANRFASLSLLDAAAAAQRSGAVSPTPPPPPPPALVPRRSGSVDSLALAASEAGDRQSMAQYQRQQDLIASWRAKHQRPEDRSSPSTTAPTSATMAMASSEAVDRCAIGGDPTQNATAGPPPITREFLVAAAPDRTAAQPQLQLQQQPPQLQQTRRRVSQQHQPTSATPTPTSTSVISGSVIESMHHHLSTAFKYAYDEGSAIADMKLEALRVGGQRTGPLLPQQPPPVVYILKCIDYCDKYGLGYQLTNGVTGVYFNDSSCMVLAPNRVNFEYLFQYRPASSALANGTGPPQMKRQAHTVDQYPPELAKKVTLMMHFKNYMDTHMVPLPASAMDMAKTHDLEFVTKYYRQRDDDQGARDSVFRLSNQVLQMNFSDHGKLILWDSGRAVLFVDPTRGKHAVQLADFGRIRRQATGAATAAAVGPLPSRALAVDFMRRMAAVKDLVDKLWRKRSATLAAGSPAATPLRVIGASSGATPSHPVPPPPPALGSMAPHNPYHQQQQQRSRERRSVVPSPPPPPQPSHEASGGWPSSAPMQRTVPSIMPRPLHSDTVAMGGSSGTTHQDYGTTSSTSAGRPSLLQQHLHQQQQYHHQQQQQQQQAMTYPPQLPLSAYPRLVHSRSESGLAAATAAERTSLSTSAATSMLASSGVRASGTSAAAMAASTRSVGYRGSGSYGPAVVPTPLTRMDDHSSARHQHHQQQQAESSQQWSRGDEVQGYLTRARAAAQQQQQQQQQQYQRR